MANYYKIINVTSNLGKRHPKKNSTLNIQYGNGFQLMEKKLAPGSEMFIICNHLPKNIQKLSLEKLVIINRVTENEYKRTQRKASTPQKVDKPEEVKEITEVPEEKPKKKYRKKSTSKSSSEKKESNVDEEKELETEEETSEE
jgi:hypothetical protein